MTLTNTGELREKQWYTHTIEPYEGDLNQKILNSFCDEIENYLIKSLEKRLVADVPIGLFLSAGLDSTLVAVLTSKVFGKSLETFSYGTNEQRTEHNIAEYLSNKLGHKPNSIVSSQKDILNEATNCGHLLDEPLADRGVISQRIISRLAKSKVTVCLSGDGGDELFGGYGRYLKGKLSEDHFADSFKGSFAYEYFNSLLPVFKAEDLIRIFPDNIKALDDTISRFYSLTLDPSLKNGIHVMRNIDLESYLPDCVLAKVDRCTMAESLESRTPFLNPYIMAICERLPAEYCVNSKSKEQKLILRSILAKYLEKDDQDLLFKITKQGFGVSNELFASNATFILDQINRSSETLYKSGALESGEIEKIMKVMNTKNSAWAFIVLGQWIESLIEYRKNKV